MRQVLLLLMFGTSFSALADENKMKEIIEPALQRNFDDAYEKARLLSENGKIDYIDSHGNELSESKGVIVGLIKEVEKIDKKCKKILSQESIEGLTTDAKKCRSFSPQNDEEAESEIGKTCSEYRNKIVEVDKCGLDGQMGNLLKSLKSYSGVDFNTFVGPYEAKIKELNSLQNSLNEQTKKENDQKEAAEKQKLAEEEKLKSTPQYKKCLYMSRLVSDKKMLNLWNKNIDEIKNDSKTAGVMTMKMQRDMDNSIGFVKAYKFKISESEKQLKTYSTISASESQCKKLISDFGASDADRYAK